MSGQGGAGLASNPGRPEHPPVAEGYVSRSQPAPATFADPLWVIIPTYSPDSPYRCAGWAECHGNTLPAQGARVVVTFGTEGVPTVVWWEGAHSTHTPALVSELPGSPVDGEEVYLQTSTMAAAGVVWSLRYRAASGSTHKWEFAGGSRLWSGQSGAVETEATAAKELTGGPTLAVPFAGDYEVSLRVYMQARAEGVNELHATVAGAAVVQRVVRATFDGGFEYVAHSVAGLTASQVLKVEVSMNSAIKAAFSTAQVSLQPIRLG